MFVSGLPVAILTSCIVRSIDIVLYFVLILNDMRQRRTGGPNVASYTSHTYPGIYCVQMVPDPSSFIGIPVSVGITGGSFIHTLGEIPHDQAKPATHVKRHFLFFLSRSQRGLGGLIYDNYCYISLPQLVGPSSRFRQLRRPRFRL